VEKYSALHLMNVFTHKNKHNEFLLNSYSQISGL